MPGIWLTPLLTDQDVLTGVLANHAPQLLFGGTADPAWDSRLAADLADSAEVLAIPGADHCLDLATPAETESLHRWVGQRIGRFLGNVAPL